MGSVDHDTFEKQMAEQEQLAREHALQLRRLEIELGIFKPMPRIVTDGDE